MSGIGFGLAFAYRLELLVDVIGELLDELLAFDVNRFPEHRNDIAQRRHHVLTHAMTSS